MDKKDEQEIKTTVEQIAQLDLESEQATSVDDFGQVAACVNASAILTIALEESGITIEEDERTETWNIMQNQKTLFVFNLAEWTWKESEA